jgi:hypothetical protein
MPEQEQQPTLANAIETEWVRGYARTYFPSEAPFTYRPALLRRKRITLVDIRNALRSGVVTFSDKCDGPGAIWVVEGDDADGRRIVVTLHVVSETMSVTLQDVEVVRSIEKGGDNDAA